MEQTIKKMSFPSGGSKGYVFAGYKTKISAEQAIQFLKEQGDFLCLNEECKVKPECKRITELVVINKEVIIKLRYRFYDMSHYISTARSDAEDLLQQVENLLEYAEKSSKK